MSLLSKARQDEEDRRCARWYRNGMSVRDVARQLGGVKKSQAKKRIDRGERLLSMDEGHAHPAAEQESVSA